MKGLKFRICTALCIYIFFFAVIIAGTVFCESKNREPLKLTINFGDTKCECETKYENGDIDVKIKTDLQITSWQKEILKQQKPEVNFVYGKNETVVSANDIIAELGKPLEASFKIRNASSSLYVKLKTAIISRDNVSISTSNAIAFAEETRQKAKQEYERQKAQQKQLEQYRKQMQEYYNNYYW